MTILRDPTPDNFRWVSSKFQDSIEPGSGYRSYVILSIKTIHNRDLYYRYKNDKRQIKRRHRRRRSNERNLFHASSSADEILKNGLDERYAKTSGNFGAGIYFAEKSSKSNDYAFGLNSGCGAHNDKNCEKCTRKMFLCRVNLGKTLKTNQTMSGQAHAPPGYDSVTGNLSTKEFVIYRREQAFPNYLITYKIKK